MTRDEIFGLIRSKESYLCVGLDSDLNKMPHHLRTEPDPVFTFNKQIIDATIDHAVAYKPNIAFYESMGSKGWDSLEKTIEYIPDEVFTIADAKRGDIGNTSEMYAKAYFDNMGFDSITVSPYMGQDSIQPYLDHDGKWVIVLAKTSNSGSDDFQKLHVYDNDNFFDIVHRDLFTEVVKKCMTWASPDQLMFVVGATEPKILGMIRTQAPDYFFLVPGLGAQGGDLEVISDAGMNSECGILVNASRSIIYAANDKSFDYSAKKEAERIQGKMKEYLEKFCINK